MIEGSGNGIGEGFEAEGLVWNSSPLVKGKAAGERLAEKFAIEHPLLESVARAAFPRGGEEAANALVVELAFASSGPFAGAPTAGGIEADGAGISLVTPIDNVFGVDVVSALHLGGGEVPGVGRGAGGREGNGMEPLARTSHVDAADSEHG